MKKQITRLIGMAMCLALLLGCFPAAFAEDSCTVTLNYQIGNYPDEQFTVASGTQMSKALNGTTFQNVSRYVYGYDFDNWYYDAECTKGYARKDAIKKDLTLYANWTPWDAERQEVMDAWLAEMDACKELLNYMPMYSYETFWPFHEELFMKWGSTSKATWEYIEKMKTLRESLVQVREKDEVIWELWGEDIPQEELGEDLTGLHQDVASFRPLLDVFMLEDQSQVKGNIIAVSGGGREHRSNNAEGYPTALHMNALGYNVFVLQYRVKPYAEIDSFLDLQRAIRYIRYHAEDKGIGAIENIATIGYSAGAGVCSGQIAFCFGDILPTAYYPDYVCDEIDYVNSDVKASAPIYGIRDTRVENIIQSGNQNIPAIFTAVGTADSLFVPCVEGFLAMKDITSCELHIYDGVPHAFGMADQYTGADQIDEQFDAFLMVHFGLEPRVRMR